MIYLIERKRRKSDFNAAQFIINIIVAPKRFAGSAKYNICFILVYIYYNAFYIAYNEQAFKKLILFRQEIGIYDKAHHNFL